MGTQGSPIRVIVVQPALPKYRIPVFRELAARPGLSLEVVYGEVGGLSNVSPEGFEAVATPRREIGIAGRSLFLHGAEWRYCNPTRADVIVLRWSVRSITSILGLLRAARKGMPIVLWGHGYSKTEKGWWRALRNWFARKADALVFYDPRTRDQFVREGWSPDKLFVAINSLDSGEIESAIDHWRNDPAALRKFQEEHGLTDGPVVLYVSRLSPANRLELLIEATAKLAKEIGGLKTVIIGNGDEERKRLVEFAASLQIQDNVVFQDGIYDERKLAPWFLSASVFCYPANIGLSLLHAFWYGVPVVTSDKLEIQNPEIVALESGRNGLLYEHGNVEALVEALRTILVDPELRSSMSRAARQTVEEKFTIAQMVDQLEAAIRHAYQAKSVGAA